MYKSLTHTYNDFFYCGDQGLNPGPAYIMHCPFQPS